MATRDAFRVSRGAAVAVLVLCIAACGRGGEEQKAAATAPAGGEPAPTAREGSEVTLAPMPTHKQEMPGGGAPPGHEGMMAESTSGALRWTAPKEWVEVPPSSPMRRAQYRLPAAGGDREDGECVVYYFGAGQGGDAQANIQRWIAQFSGPGSEQAKTTEIKAGRLTVTRVEVGGTYTPSPMMMSGGPAPRPKPGTILLGAIVPGGDANWFFKCTGAEKTMKENRARFDAMLESIRAAQ